MALAAVVADQLTKSIVSNELGLGESLRVVGGFEIHHVYNTGIAFGFLGGWAAPVTILTGVAVLWMLGFFARAGARHPVLPVALGLLVGGALSNLIDRVRLGHVTDFLDPPYWPAFNLADTFICAGVAILLVALAGAESEPFFPQRERAEGRLGRFLARTGGDAARGKPQESSPISIVVPGEAAGERLDRFLAALPDVGSRSAAERLLARGRVAVDGASRPKSHGLEGGEEVSLEIETRASSSCPRISTSASPGRTSTFSSWTSRRRRRPPVRRPPIGHPRPRSPRACDRGW